MNIRNALINRTTKETEIALTWNTDGQGTFAGTSGIGFLDHMLTLFCHHARCDMTLSCQGDLQVDGHHTVEDVGICIGMALREALGNKDGIQRYGSFFLPMDETLAQVHVDISNRPYLVWNMLPLPLMLGDMDSQLLKEFFRAVCQHAGLTLHITVQYGENGHHIAEAVFKGWARAMAQAWQVTGKSASSKGLL